jgi:hypothetical protein
MASGIDARCAFVFNFVCMPGLVHIYTYTHICINIHVYICKCINTHTHTHTHTQTNTAVSSPSEQEADAETATLAFDRRVSELRAYALAHGHGVCVSERQFRVYSVRFWVLGLRAEHHGHGVGGGGAFVGRGGAHAVVHVREDATRLKYLLVRLLVRLRLWGGGYICSARAAR